MILSETTQKRHIDGEYVEMLDVNDDLFDIEQQTDFFLQHYNVYISGDEDKNMSVDVMVGDSLMLTYDDIINRAKQLMISDGVKINGDEVFYIKVSNLIPYICVTNIFFKLKKLKVNFCIK